ncbi:YolD-like protein [Paenibacillus algorifonticola]|uniref:YolD-like protein n=1 Tax=Paenibacillus algorifonticola TaxID=684063 RepID=A0A1I1Y9S7_9BACL|nr:YolD-like family protein [Paenibacillus algorifonticola]SFE14883.1 YolD-like protein [Paenibacillus algorifonticola]
MSKKLEKNGLWESSRMMLPEHKEAYILYQQNLRKNSRPQLDDQETERLSSIIAESMLFRKEVTLVLFGEFDNSELTGVVTKIDQQQKNVRLARGNDFVWINTENIIGAMFY